MINTSLFIIISGCFGARTLDFNYQAPKLDSDTQKQNKPFNIGIISDNRDQFKGHTIGVLCYNDYTPYGQRIPRRIPYQANSPVAQILQEGMRDYFTSEGYSLSHFQTDTALSLSGEIYKINFEINFAGFAHSKLNVGIESVFKITDKQTDKVLWVDNVQGNNVPKHSRYNTLLKNVKVPSNEQVIAALNEAMTNLFENLTASPGFQKTIGLTPSQD